MVMPSGVVQDDGEGEDSRERTSPRVTCDGIENVFPLGVSIIHNNTVRSRLPSHQKHCDESLRRYGKSFSELHRWMDELSTLLSKGHRAQRHDANETPKIAKKLFGEFADQACLDHIRLDYLESREWKGKRTICKHCGKTIKTGRRKHLKEQHPQEFGNMTMEQLLRIYAKHFDFPKNEKENIY